MSFQMPGLSQAMLQNLASLGFTSPTPIQQQALPAVLAGRDVIAMARTGSGKTAAFGIGLVEQLTVRRFAVQGMVLCPTRELADQVARAIRELARSHHNVKVLTLCGGTPIGPQIGSLSHGAHIVVGTPGRVKDHLDKGTLVLDQLRTLVLDEADRMLDMGFEDAMAAILARCPQRRQTLLFSATWPDHVRRLSGRFQQDPVSVTVEDPPASATAAIEEVFYEVPGDQRQEALTGLLSLRQPAACLIFCATKQQCDEVTQALTRQGFAAASLHGDMDQKERDQVLILFANQSCPI